MTKKTKSIIFKEMNRKQGREMKNIIDLHTHTTKSDGTYTPNELLRKAEEIGLEILSITDHESVEGYYELNRNLYKGILIPGIELRTTCFGITIELLGYGFDISKMRKLIKRYNYKNNEELDKYIIDLAYQQYKNRGIIISDSFIDDYNPEVYIKPSKYIERCIFEYPENKELLKELPEGKSFFRHCITNPDSPLFLDFSSIFPNLGELVFIIKEAGGLVSIPHIFEYKNNAKKILNNLLDNYDIDMIECYYSSFSKEQTEYLINICIERGKYISGGSDFHGNVRPQVLLGMGENNNLNIPREQINKWIKREYLI